MKFGSAFHFDLEAGSKSELLLAMSCLCKGNPEALLVYNGFKDANYIVFALVTRKFALNIVIIPEQEEELDQVFTTMHAMLSSMHNWWLQASCFIAPSTSLLLYPMPIYGEASNHNFVALEETWSFYSAKSWTLNEALSEGHSSCRRRTVHSWKPVPSSG